MAIRHEFTRIKPILCFFRVVVYDYILEDYQSSYLGAAAGQNWTLVKRA